MTASWKIDGRIWTPEAVREMDQAHTRLIRAAAEALSLMQALGWVQATATDGLDDDGMVEAIAAETAYSHLKDALPIPAVFAAELVRDPLSDARKAVQDKTQQ